MFKYWFAAGIAMLACVAVAASASDGVTDSTILIGQTVGLTGTVAGPVKEANEGANAYFASINKSGGVNGRQIKLLTVDDKFDPALTAANAEDLIAKQHVFALFQGRGTPHTQGILPILAAHEVPLIAPATGAVIFREPVNHWVFNIRAKYQDEVAKAVQEFSTIGMKKIGLLYVDDSFGQDSLEGFKKALAESKLTPAGITLFARVQPDYAATAKEAMQADPQALIIASSSKNTIEVIKALRAVGSHIQLMTLSNNSSESFVKELGAAGQGVIVSQVVPAPDLLSTELGQEFKNAAKASGATISYAAMEGFVNAKVLVEGLRRAGRNLTREGLVRALESMHHVDLGGLQISYDANNHAGSKYVELTIVGKTGHFVR
jgi:ABC-type branched-subunit amino acid transport system substrate-binding protein